MVKIIGPVLRGIWFFDRGVVWWTRGVPVPGSGPAGGCAGWPHRGPVRPRGPHSCRHWTPGRFFQVSSGCGTPASSASWAPAPSCPCWTPSAWRRAIHRCRCRSARTWVTQQDRLGKMTRKWHKTDTQKKINKKDRNVRKMTKKWPKIDPKLTQKWDKKI